MQDLSAPYAQRNPIFDAAVNLNLASPVPTSLITCLPGRVAKCHGYGGYIHVKKLGGRGKKSGRTHCFAKSSIVLGKFEQLI